MDCGHERPTNLPFIANNYSKPKIGEDCYCRECWIDTKIVGVKKAPQKEAEELQSLWEKLLP